MQMFIYVQIFKSLDSEAQLNEKRVLILRILLSQSRPSHCRVESVLNLILWFPLVCGSSQVAHGLCEVPSMKVLTRGMMKEH